MKWIILSAVLLAGSPSLAQTVRSSWEIVPSPRAKINLFAAFDSINIIYIVGADSGAFYSSNRGTTWMAITEPSIATSSSLDIVRGVAIAVSRSDSSDYSSSDMGRTWIRHPWAPLPSTVKSRPEVKRWYGVGKGWYENIERIPQPFPPDLVRYNYLRQDVAFGPLISVESIVHDFLAPQSFDAADSGIYAFSGGSAKYVEGEVRVDWSPARGVTDLKYLGEKSWMVYDQYQQSRDIFVYLNTPLSEPIKFSFEYPFYQVFSKSKIVIATPWGPFLTDGAYISQDAGNSWSKMQIFEKNTMDSALHLPPEIWILDSMHMFMHYDSLYYTNQGGGPTSPLASVAAARDARPGVAVFGSVLSVAGGGEIEVLDLLGRRIVRAEPSASGEPVKINLLPYPDGIYFVRSGQEFTKILWQRE